MEINTKDKVKNIFNYLLSIKNMNEDVIRNVDSYKKLYWEADFHNVKAVKSKESDVWLRVDSSSKELYDKLFELYLTMEKERDNLELVYGHWFLVYDTGDVKINHPIFTNKMELSFDAEKGEFILTASSNISNFEIDILQGLNLPNIDKLIGVKNKYMDNLVDPRDAEKVKDLLYEITHYISSDINPSGEVQFNLISAQKIKPSKYPIFYNSPALILRENDRRLWNTELNNIISRIDEGYPIPPTVKSLVEEQNIKQDDKDLKEWENVDDNLLFPLPANPEQKQVVKKLCENYGVVIQGPPGTGKSHTIVNLVCHLLANGKRVLVTSQTGRALRVLSDKIPDEIKPLCISVLGDDTKSLRDLDEAVRIITENLSLNPQELINETEPLKEKLNELQEKDKELFEQLKETEKIENKTVKYKGNCYKLVEIAKWVKENEKNNQWIEEDIPLDKECPLNDMQMLRLIYLLDNLNQRDISIIEKSGITWEAIPKIEIVIKNINRYMYLKENLDKYKEVLVDWSIPYNKDSDYEKILILIQEAHEKILSIQNSWAKELMKYYYNSEVAKPVIKQLMFRCQYYIRNLRDIKEKLDLHKIEVPETREYENILNDLKEVQSELKSKGKIRRSFKMFHGKCEYIFSGCRVDGKTIETLEQSEYLKLFVQEAIISKDMTDLWNDIMTQYGATQIVNLNVGSLMKLENDMKIINLIIDWDENYRSKIIKQLGSITVLNELDWCIPQTYCSLSKGVEALKGIEDYNTTKAYIENATKILNSIGGNEELIKAIEENDEQKIIQNYDKVEKLKVNSPKVKELNLFFNKLKEVTPTTAEKIYTDKDRDKYKKINKAWKWKQLNGLLVKVHKISPETIKGLLSENTKKENVLIKNIVAKKCWYNQIINTTEVQKRSLYAWLQVVKKLGKGRSKFYSKYSLMAQNEMEKCKDCIPVWIMPLNRVIENIKLNGNLFDVVIFDESSQSDIFAISALMRGKKAVIVGDDKQISPQPVGIDGSIVNSLIDRYLSGIPHYEWFDLETSLYNTALRVFPERLLLKEHFRCVPEIIDFSNELCYSGEIIPLRHAKENERFEPVINAIRVEDGLRDKIKSINMKEAEQLVDQIVKCCEDAKYRDMTMGVISLLGEEQAEVIENMLKVKIGEKEMIKRKLICGDAYSFQGDERDIMFLSMVVADNVKTTALTKESDIRRFNVAVSRARNQLWLYYSIDPNSISSSCVRSKLLNYCIDPSNSNKKKEQEHIFDNDFQKDVYSIIKNRGFKIIPIVNIGKCKVDFVIEGVSTRIAVVCDTGWRSNFEHLNEKLERQKSLEGVGWTFFTIRASEFYRSPERVMEKLWDKLEKLGVERVTA